VLRAPTGTYIQLFPHWAAPPSTGPTGPLMSVGVLPFQQRIGQEIAHFGKTPCRGNLEAYMQVNRSKLTRTHKWRQNCRGEGSRTGVGNASTLAVLT